MGALLLLAFGTAAATKSAYAQQTELVRWPPSLAPRGPALAKAIEQELGEQVRWIVFTGPDSMEVMVWNPTIWSGDMHTRDLPEETLPIVRKAQLHAAIFVWNTFARDAGINYLSVSFFRVLREEHMGLTREMPHQQVGIHITRQQFEQGHPELGATGFSKW